jgi:selenide,water dikinase
MIASTTLLNRVGAVLAEDDDVHGITDVTGFGLLGHGLEMARGSGMTLEIAYDRIPFLSEAASFARDGYATGASGRNWASYGDGIVLPPDLPAWQRTLLTDPQTSGGLLVACAAERAADIRASIVAAGYGLAAVIGSVSAGEPVVRIT